MKNIFILALLSTAFGQDESTGKSAELLPRSRSRPMERPDLFQGDIAGIDPETFRGAMTSTNMRWSNGVVHYVLDSSYNQYEVNIIYAAMNSYISSGTCIRFVPRTNERDYIYIYPGNGCWSRVGREGGMQYISLQKNWCVSHGTVVHELMHAIGFWHEQSRPDRDDYVNIYWANIDQSQLHNFNKMNTQNLGSPYDYGSVMHYKSDAFARSWGLTTITAKQGGVSLGNDYGLSLHDAWQINRLYGCSKK